MKVYRIENSRDGGGPYSSGAPMDMYDYFGSRHPAPQDDGIGYPDRSLFFGFANLLQMFQWFHWTDVFRWRKHEFKVYRYQVPDREVRIGGRQLAFVKTSATSRQEVRVAALAKHLIRLPLLGS